VLKGHWEGSTTLSDNGPDYGLGILGYWDIGYCETRETREIKNRWRIFIEIAEYHLNALPSPSRRGTGGEVS
jgi:hypothetical protein